MDKSDFFKWIKCFSYWLFSAQFFGELPHARLQPRVLDDGERIFVIPTAAGISGLLSRGNRLLTSGIRRSAFTGSVNGLRLTDGQRLRDTCVLQVRNEHIKRVRHGVAPDRAHASRRPSYLPWRSLQWPTGPACAL